MDRLSLCCGSTLLLLTSGTISAAPAADADQPAIWKTQEFVFNYSGFTTRYSCQGLRDTLRKVAPALGAREADLKISYQTCGADTSRPAPFVSVKIHLSTLVPAPAGGAPNAIQARWEPVDLTRSAKLDAGDCELDQQILQQFGKVIAARNSGSFPSCPNHQLPTGSPELRFEILRELPPPQ